MHSARTARRESDMRGPITRGDAAKIPASDRSRHRKQREDRDQLDRPMNSVTGPQVFGPLTMYVAFREESRVPGSLLISLPAGPTSTRCGLACGRTVVRRRLRVDVGHTAQRRLDAADTTGAGSAP